MPYHAYLWCWWNDANLATLQHNLALLEGLNVPFLWLDLERAQGDGIELLGVNDRIALALRMLDFLGGPEHVGVYSAQWFFRDYLQNTTAFNEYRCWAMEQTGPTLDVFTPYGGWDRPVIKQYALDTALCGMEAIDLNVIDPAVLDYGISEPAPDGLAHLDAAYGHFREILERTRSPRIAQHAEQGQGELLALKAALGWSA